MKYIAAGLIFLISVVTAVWVGFFKMFLPGFVQIVDQINADKADGRAVATGILKVVFASFCGSLIIAAGAVIAIFITQYDNHDRY